MATGPEHYREAERELMEDLGCEYGCPHAGCAHEMAHIARAQAHATLALAAATALIGAMDEPPQRDASAWYRAAGTKPAKDTDTYADEGAEQ